MFMSERAALLAAVIASPDDDVPRLVFADWLEENRDAERAVFIRAEIDAERSAPDSAEREYYETLAAKLVNLHGERWNRELPGWDAWYDTRAVYRRGFVEELHTNFRTFTFNDAGLFRAAPIRMLALDSRSGALPNVAGLSVSVKVPPDLSRIEQFRLGPRLRFGPTDDSLASPGNAARQLFDLLFTYPTLTNLRRLTLAQLGLTNPVGEYVVRQLAGAPFRESLRELDLSGNRLTDSAAWTIAAVKGLDRLEHLNLRDNQLTRAGLRVLENRFGERLA